MTTIKQIGTACGTLVFIETFIDDEKTARDARYFKTRESLELFTDGLTAALQENGPVKREIDLTANCNFIFGEIDAQLEKKWRQ
jgi:hypothetical protein